LTPKSLILNLVMAAQEPTTSQAIIRICQLFDITENSARVSLARLVSDDLLESTSRGVYQLAPKASRLSDDLADWRNIEDKIKPWDGSWIAVFIANLGRGNRTALRHRTRILQLAGFSELDQGLMVRPNNLVGGAATLRQRLVKLGLEGEARIFTLSDLDETTQQQAINLWDIESLNAHYIQGQADMSRWLENMSELSPQAAAREVFVIGDNTLRHLAFDPLLPSEMVNVESRKQYIQTMIKYDQIGRAIWVELYNSVA